ncbi:Hypothetical_protein [Hexamita inflata]|uniref:Hypothetical_protein n=1 Tax=Hexamita inflata TaxID=28002 RepID=A0ABP1KZH7_9EUKA
MHQIQQQSLSFITAVVEEIDFHQHSVYDNEPTTQTLSYSGIMSSLKQFNIVLKFQLLLLSWLKYQNRTNSYQQIILINLMSILLNCIILIDITTLQKLAYELRI